MRTWMVMLAICAFVAVAGSGSAQAMTFQRVGGGLCDLRPCVVASGPIERTSVKAFTSFARAHNLTEGALVFLQSEGGSHVGGIALGIEFRRRRVDTYVANPADDPALANGATCASACVYAFMGGVRRSVAPGSRLGVHQVSIASAVSLQASIANAQSYMSLAAIHLQAMGATPDVVVLALRTPPETCHWLSRNELRRFNVVTTEAHLSELDRASAGFGAPASGR